MYNKSSLRDHTGGNVFLTFDDRELYIAYVRGRGLRAPTLRLRGELISLGLSKVFLFRDVAQSGSVHHPNKVNFLGDPEFAWGRKAPFDRSVAQLVARTAGGREVAGSSPVTPTIAISLYLCYKLLIII